MTRAELAKTVDTLGRARDKLHVLKFEERALTETVREALEAQGGKDAQLAGAKYTAELLVSHGVQIVDVAALKRAAGRKFLQVVKADLAAVRRLLGDAAAKRLGKPVQTVKVRVTSREPATAPRKAPSK